VRALLDDAAIVEDENAIGFSDRGDVVRDDFQYGRTSRSAKAVTNSQLYSGCGGGTVPS
jgi:hypothetical protein